MPPPCTLTIDLHDGDLPEDILASARWLDERGILATYLIPTVMLATPRYVPALRALGRTAHELGTHSHHHDYAEIDALRGKDPSRGALDFLRTSARAFEDFFGRAPKTFRSPCWSGVSPRAYAELFELGYEVDSSAAPQRLSILGSLPDDNTWFRSKRDPHFVHRGLLEVPGTCFGIPVGTASFRLFRRVGALAFVTPFLIESKLTLRPLNIELHAFDFTARKEPLDTIGRWELGHLLVKRRGGWGFRHFIQATDRQQIFRTTASVIELLRTAGFEFSTLSQFRARLIRHVDMG